jgi:small nuclear ribonucleoprotein D3
MARQGNIGVPVKLLHEAQGLTVSIETKTGHVYRGTLESIEDNMNVQLKQVIVTGRDGQLTPMENIMLRGSSIRFFIVPDNLKHAPMLLPKETTRRVNVNASGPLNK